MTFVSKEPDKLVRTGELAEELARRIALAIDNVRLYHDAQEAILNRDEFLSVASHELRTPVTSLQLVVQGLLHGIVPTTPDSIARTLKLVDRQTSRLGRLINEMLSVGYIQGGRLKLQLDDVDLAAVVREAADRFAADLAAAHCQLDVRSPEKVIGRWDKDKLDQVVTNLLSNAIKFGTGMPIEVVLEEKGPLARLVVTDHGIGIQPEGLSRLFQKFERAVSARAYGGLGLGPLHRAGHRGSARRYGAGRERRHWMRRGAHRGAAPQHGEKRVSPVPPTVMLVDDDPDILEAMDMVLDGAGYSVLTARSGKEALGLLRSHGPLPAVIVLDLMMPEMNGWQFRAEQAKDPALGRVPVVVLSGARDLAEKAAALGCSHYLQKPVGVHMLLAAIDAVGVHVN